MENKETVVRSGFSLFSIAFILALVFFILKVTDVLAWSWVWVLSPLWIYAALAVGGFRFALSRFSHLCYRFRRGQVKTAEKVPLLKVATERSLFSYINTLI